MDAELGNFPGWTALDVASDEHAGQYPLGLDAVGMGIVANFLLPGITNATNRARYYSLLSWIAVKSGERATQGGKRDASGAEHLRWLQRLEALVRAATLDYDEKVLGLVGVGAAVRINGWEGGDVDLIDSNRDPATAFAIAAYGASFEFLKLGKRREGGNVIQVKDRARALAAALERSMSPSNRKALSVVLDGDWKRTPVGEVRALREDLALRPLTPATREYEAVRDLIFWPPGGAESHPDDQKQAVRSRTLGLILQVLEDNQSPSDDDALHTVFSTRLLPGAGKEFVPHATFAREAAAWLRYEERQVIKFALYGLWYEVVSYIEGRAATRVQPADIHGEFRRALVDANRTLELFGFGASDQVGVTMERLYDRSAAPRGELWSAAAEWVTRLNDPASEGGVRVQACLCLLLLATRHWELRRESMTSESAALHTRGRRHRLSLETVSADIRNRAEWSVMSLLEWVVDSYVCSQSLRFALEKLRNGQYRFFIERDEDGYRVVKPDSGRGYLRRDADRLKGALGLLYDLGMTTDAKSPQITAAGKQWWRHLAIVHA